MCAHFISAAPHSHSPAFHDRRAIYNLLIFLRPRVGPDEILPEQRIFIFYYPHHLYYLLITVSIYFIMRCGIDFRSKLLGDRRGVSDRVYIHTYSGGVVVGGGERLSGIVAPWLEGTPPSKAHQFLVQN